MSRLKIIVPTALTFAGLLTGLLISSTAGYAKKEFTTQTKKPCTYCHVDAVKAPKELKAPGKYYQEHKSLDGYQEKK